MNEPQDEGRARARRRGARSRLRRRIDILIVVVGCLSMLIAGIIFGLSFPQSAPVREKLNTMSIGYAVGGVSLVMIHFVLFSVPEWRRRRADQRRRLGDYRDMRVTGNPVLEQDSPRSGMVLIYVLVLVALIAALVTQAQVASRRALRTAQAGLEIGDLRRAATDAAFSAFRRLADDDNLSVDSTNDAWAATERSLTPGGVATEVSVVDLDRCFDLNNLSLVTAPGARPADEIVADLMIQCGNFTPSSFIDALMDWTDADQEGMREDEFYAKRTPPHAAANRVAYTWGELLGADGASREALTGQPRLSNLEPFRLNLDDCATLLPVPRDRPFTVNLNTATRGALLGLFGLAQERLVNTIIVLRALKPISSLESISYTADPLLFETVRPYVDVKSQFFRVEATAVRDQKSAKVRALVRRNGEGRVDVVQWLY